jgi:hypothetical protein
MTAFDPGSFDRFDFVGFTIDRAAGSIAFAYRISGPGGSVPFEEDWTFPNAIPAGAAGVAFERLARLMFLSVGLSYYKASAARVIRLAGTWTEAEIGYLRRLIVNGLAEFAFRNSLPGPLEPSIECNIRESAVDPVELPARNLARILTPVGGGKDSCVTLDAITRAGLDQTLFVVGRHQPVIDVAQRAQLPLLQARRTISPALLDLNRQGALNGHVPVTAINSVAALMTAATQGAGRVLMSNERSASTPTTTWGDFPVNHQWSKGIDFERELRAVVSGGVANLEYASLLRPYSEYRIAERFAELTQYHDVFVSCGRAFALDSDPSQRWCGACDKCLFVGLILAPFLGHGAIKGFMGTDIFVDRNLGAFEGLLALSGSRPFDCVGEIDETRLAVRRALPSWSDVPVLASLAASLGEWQPSAEVLDRILLPGDVHALPPGLERVLDAAR